MNYLTILAGAAMVLASHTDLFAQTKTGKSNNGRQEQKSTTLRAAEKENATEKATNVSQTREFELEKENGYYQMPGYRDWGTNAKLNGYPYPVIDPSQHPDADIDTTGGDIQSGLYDKGGNPSGTGVPVRKKIDHLKSQDSNPPAGNKATKGKK